MAYILNHGLLQAMDVHHPILPPLTLLFVELLCLSLEAGDSYHGGHHQHQGQHKEHHQGNIPHRSRKAEDKVFYKISVHGPDMLGYFCQGAALLF